MKDKRLRLIYFTLSLWIIFGGMGIVFTTSLTMMAIYYVSLTGFVGSYIFGESFRKSGKTALFISGPNSKREILINITVVLWFILGIVGVIKGIDMNQLSAYFAALTPFVASYIIAETAKPDDKSTTPQ